MKFYLALPIFAFIASTNAHAVHSPNCSGICPTGTCSTSPNPPNPSSPCCNPPATCIPQVKTILAGSLFVCEKGTPQPAPQEKVPNELTDRNVFTCTEVNPKDLESEK